MHRLPHHHLCPLVFQHEGGETVQIGVVLGPLDGFQGARERAGRIRQRQSDPHRADVDSEDPATLLLRTGRRRHLPVLRQAATEVGLRGRVMGRLRAARPGRGDGGQLAPPSADRAGVLGVVLGVGHVGHLPAAAAIACSPACNAAGIPAGSVPPPCATSAFPPPRPPTGGAAAFSTSLADSPRSSAAWFNAATSATLPPDSEASSTTTGLSPGSRPRTSSASVRRSPPPRPDGDPVTSATPSTSLAPAASWPAAATDCCDRSSASSLSTSRSRASMPLPRSTSPSRGA